MAKRMLTVATVCFLTLAMGCTTTQKWAAGGAAVGATVGGIWASNGGNILSAGEGAGVGAAVGGLAGALIGDSRGKSEAWFSACDTINEKDSQIADLRTSNGQLKTKLQACESDLEACHRRNSQLEDTNGKLASELAECKGARVELTLLADVLFHTGSARLTAQGRSVLDDAAERISNYSGNEFVTVEGHTDTDPIRATAHLWKDNWDLGANRAMAVARYLITKGVEPERLAASTFSKYHPVSDEKSNNRRAVIVIHTGWPAY